METEGMGFPDGTYVETGPSDGSHIRQIVVVCTARHGTATTHALTLTLTQITRHTRVFPLSHMARIGYGRWS